MNTVPYATLQQRVRTGLMALALILPVTTLAPQHVQAAPAAAAAHSLESCLKECGFTFEQIDKRVWTTQIQAAEGTTQRVIIASSDDTLVVFSVPFKKEALASKPELVKHVNGFNEEYDLVKVFVDKDGDLSVRADLHLRILDGQELHDIVSQVVNVTEQIQKKAK